MIYLENRANIPKNITYLTGYYILFDLLVKTINIKIKLLSIMFLYNFNTTLMIFMSKFS